MSWLDEEEGLGESKSAADQQLLALAETAWRASNNTGRQLLRQRLKEAIGIS